MTHVTQKKSTKSRRALSLLLALSLLAATLLATPIMASAAGMTGRSLNKSEYITFGTYNGKPIVWRVLDIDSEKALLFSEKILTLKSYDISQDSKVHSTFGNYWPDSNIRQWLNADKDITWLHIRPNTDHTLNPINAYDEEPGFLTLNNFTAAELSAIVTTTRQQTIANEFASRSNGGNSTVRMGEIAENERNVQIQDNLYYKTVQDRVFLLSLKEIKQLIIDYTRHADMLYGYLTPEAIEKNYTAQSKATTETIWNYWTGSPDFNDPTKQYVVNERSQTLGTDGKINGSFSTVATKTDTIGIRPAMYVKLSSIELLSGSGTPVAPYKATGTVQSAVAATDFRDVPRSQWYYDSVYAAYAAGLMQGKSKTEFDPEGSLTVAELLTTCLNLLESKVVATGNYANWYDPYIKEATNRDFLRASDSFADNVDRPVTRSEMAVIIVRAAQAVNKNLVVDANSVSWVEDAFTDLRSIPSACRTSVFQAYASGLLNGYDDGTFGGANTLTRAECAAVMVRIKTGDVTRPNPT